METPEEVLARVAARIVELREQQGLTQSAVAAAVGMTTSNYQRIEYGTENLTLRTLQKIAMALGVEMSSLFERGASPKKQKGRGRPRKS